MGGRGWEGVDGRERADGREAAAHLRVGEGECGVRGAQRLRAVGARDADRDLALGRSLRDGADVDAGVGHGLGEGGAGARAEGHALADDGDD